MSRILIHAAGTLGDHLPCVALARALADRGHRPTLAINRAMLPWAERSGVAAVALPEPELGPERARRTAWAWDHWNHPDPAAHPAARPVPADDLIEQARALAGLCADADLLLATGIRPFGLIAQRASGIPWLTLSLNAYSFWQPVDAEERAAYCAQSREQHRRLLGLLALAWERLDLRGPIPEWSLGWPFARHVLLASSTVFSRPDVARLQPRQSVDQTGFWWYEDPDWAGWRPDDELAAFCERRPIALAFSSQPLEDPGALLARHVEAAALLGRPLLVQRGWAGFSEEDLPPGADRSQVLFADFLPQDWLFARACCSIQHGGIGSIARALRQGCPLLIEPFGNDQLYNASRVSLLGAGAAVQPFTATADALARVLSTQVLGGAAREKAAALGARIGAERGLDRACALIESFLERPERGEPGRMAWRVPALAQSAAPAPADAAVSAPRPTIPRIIHQSWRDADVPAGFAPWRRTWLERNPGWQLRLWTDADNRELIRTAYPWFLPIYDGYAEPIMRADAARAFVLHRHGGVYADLDCECLQPLEPLLAGRGVVLGLEPESHRERNFPERGGLPLLVSNACMASVPGHPFWEHVARELVRHHLAPGPLDATGPFLLTRACLEWPGREELTLLSPALLSPVANDEPWDELDPAVRAGLARGAFVVHHWVGSWWRPPPAPGDDRVRLLLLERGRTVGEASLSVSWLLGEAGGARPDAPLVSCLMVTKDRPGLARRAIGCYRAQRWPRRELVIVDDGADDTLAAHVAALGDPTVRHLRLPAAGRPLGELRNVALAEARGTHVAQWDDDDLSDPLRLEMQLAALHVSGAAACLLEREQLWWPAARRFGVSGRRHWEGSFVAAKAAVRPYPAERRGEDTPVIERLVAGHRVALLDAPALYTYVFTGANTFGAAHWEGLWRAATETFEGTDYEARVRATLARIESSADDTDACDGAAGISVTGGEGDAAVGGGARGPAAPPAPQPPREEPARAAGAADARPRVLLLSPVKDAAAFLPRFLENVRALGWPRERLALAFLESDSRDATAADLAAELPRLRREFARAELFRRDFGLALAVPRHEASVQRRRRATLARSRNLLLSRALRDEDWVLWVDSDVARWPPDLLSRLIAADRPIVVPHCRKEGSGETFDLNTFALRPGAERLDWGRHLVDGILQPPRGFGRLYLSDLQDRELVELDGVGGTVLLVRADLHREGLIFPVAPYRGYIETEGLAQLARDMGAGCWGLPRLDVWHP